jgi:hypothetical protein
MDFKRDLLDMMTCPTKNQLITTPAHHVAPPSRDQMPTTAEINGGNSHRYYEHDNGISVLEMISTKISGGDC